MSSQDLPFSDTLLEGDYYHDHGKGKVEGNKSVIKFDKLSNRLSIDTTLRGGNSWKADVVMERGSGKGEFQFTAKDQNWWGGIKIQVKDDYLLVESTHRDPRVESEKTVSYIMRRID